MKILVFDDSPDFVDVVIGGLRKAGLDANGIVPCSYGVEMIGKDELLSDEDILALVRDSDVIFLDHNMPEMNGEDLLKYWKEKGINFADKRVVGISSINQPYLKEQFQNLYSVDAVKQLLGL